MVFIFLLTVIFKLLTQYIHEQSKQIIKQDAKMLLQSSLELSGSWELFYTLVPQKELPVF